MTFATSLFAQVLIAKMAEDQCVNAAKGEGQGVKL